MLIGNLLFVSFYFSLALCNDKLLVEATKSPVLPPTGHSPVLTAAQKFELETVKKSLSEEKLMIPMQSPLLSSDTKSDDAGDLRKRFNLSLQEDGVVRINQVIDSQTASDILSYVNKKKLDTEQECITEGWVKDVESAWLCRNRFANVLLKKNRWDLLLPLPDHDSTNEDNNNIMRGLDRMIGKNGKVGNIIEDWFGLDAELYEFATLFSDPGSDPQNIHPDIPCISPEPPLLTCFLALQDIDSTMGPTTFIPRSNNPVFHAALNDHTKHDLMLKSVPNKLSMLKAGDCCLFDPRTLHAGGANRSEKRRCLFIISFRNPRLEDPGASNNPGSLRPELKNQKLTLRDLREMIALWKSDQEN